MTRHIYFLCGAKDFHAMDKVHLTATVVGVENVTLVSDTFEGEGQTSLVRPGYRVKPLVVIDRYTLPTPGRLADLWRNFVKLVFLPLQILQLRGLRHEIRDAVVHAVPIYYMVLCWIARIPFVGTPQGSEVLERPYVSRTYRFFAVRALRAATVVIVDSVAMRDAVRKLAGRDAIVVKNGFDTKHALGAQTAATRDRVVSMRGFQPLYRIAEIASARNASSARPPIDFVYPLYDDGYVATVRALAGPDDVFHGMVSREALYRLFSRALLAVSIPSSDSSPRSVYEAIFCGAIVALARQGYYDELPDCMKERIVLVDLADPLWLERALAFARERIGTHYRPSPEALALCDQNTLIRRIVDTVYEIPADAGAPRRALAKAAAIGDIA